ncbi:galactose mutarotase-like [Babylonia areolata]|uniref:galactose mutarotase-like n=1 Tax=Babylonia areolata TaxID=304850 RepID=UPI003FCFFA16
MPKIRSELFGQTKDEKDVTRYTLCNSTKGLEVRILDYGGIITEINVPDRNGKVEDVELGFDDMAGYESRSPYFGALMGRVAGRIAGGQFTLNDKTYKLFINNGPNSHHGGKCGFDKKMWSGVVDGDKLILTYVSPDGEENYPGELTVKVTVQVTEDNELRLDYQATTTQATPLNVTSHPFINLAGHNAGTLDDHVVMIKSDTFTPLDEHNVPTGEIRSVEGTEFDLRTPVKLGERLHKVTGGKGFDHNLCLSPSDDGQATLAARVDHPPSGRYMECYTTEPGMQFYTCFYLQVSDGKGGAKYKPFDALCLEAQHYPNSPNLPNFPNVILKPGETYRQTTIYKFGIA